MESVVVSTSVEFRDAVLDFQSEGNTVFVRRADKKGPVYRIMDRNKWDFTFHDLFEETDIQLIVRMEDVAKSLLSKDSGPLEVFHS